MGRGRQKAKQTKVARELKYHSSSIDVDALQRELAGNSGEPVGQSSPPADEPEDEDPYAEYAGYEVEDDDEPAGGYAAQSRRR
jgi:hypothetical protein